MATFSTKKTIAASPDLIGEMAQSIVSHFAAQGFETQIQAMSDGGCDISITKGGLFKAALGMRTALKVTLTPQDGSINFSAGVGIFGQQAIPTAITLFVFWPVLITQIWGLVQQSQLDDEALRVAESVAAANSATSSAYAAPSGGWQPASPEPAAAAQRYCTSCGQSIPTTARFCPHCGQQQ